MVIIVYIIFFDLYDFDPRLPVTLGCHIRRDP